MTRDERERWIEQHKTARQYSYDLCVAEIDISEHLRDAMAVADSTQVCEVCAARYRNTTPGAHPMAPTRAGGDLEAQVRKLTEQLNTPEILDFAKAVNLEAAHQRERWGTDHDGGKTDADWFWLVGYLAGKAMHIPEKRLHHLITAAAALANWHLYSLGKTNMRPGIETPTPAPPASDVKLLARVQPCGCILCTCEDEVRCHGCGAKNCGTHPFGEIPNPVYITAPIAHREAGGVLNELRAAGFSVAVHNDYTLNGERMTFWLLTKDGRAYKGEGKTDEEALAHVKEQVATPPPATKEAQE